jgi:hypothetical protein
VAKKAQGDSSVEKAALKQKTRFRIDPHETMEIPHTELARGHMVVIDYDRSGMAILKRVEVVERDRCSKRGTHVNDVLCFDMPVRVAK